jgi:hypothetical protein
MVGSQGRALTRPGSVSADGRVSSSTSNTLVDPAQDFTGLEGKYVRIIEGAGAGDVLQITTVSGGTLTLDGTWSTNPDNSSLYEVFAPEADVISIRGTVSSATSNSLVDTTQDFTGLEGKYVRIIEGAGAGDVLQITTVSGDTLTLDGTWSTNPDNSSLYEVFETVGYSIELKRYDGLKIPILQMKVIDDERAAVEITESYGQAYTAELNGLSVSSATSFTATGDLSGLVEGTVVQTVNFVNPANNGLFKVTEIVGTTINVTNVDNSEAHLVVETPATGARLHVHDGTTQLREGVPGTETFDVSLTRAPTADVIVTLTADSQVNISYNGQSTDTTTREITLTFTPTDWATKTVDIEAVFDTLVEGFHFGNVTATVSSADIDLTIVAPTFVQEALPEGEVLPTSVDLPHKPVGEITVTFEIEPETYDHYEVVSNTVLFLNEANKPVEVDGKIQVDYSYIEPGYDGTPVRRVVAAITDDNAPGVLITESNGSTDVIEFDGSFLTDVDETILKENSVNGDFDASSTKHNAIGDFSQTITKNNVVSTGNVDNEYISVVADAGGAESVNLGNLFTAKYSDTNSTSATATASRTLTQAQLETLLGDSTTGTIFIRVTPNGEVDDFTGEDPPVNNSLAVTLSVDAAPLVYEFNLGKHFVPDGDATLSFDITADINDPNEYITIVAAGGATSFNLGDLFDGSYPSTDGGRSASETDSVTLSQAQLEALLADSTDGKIFITVTPSSAVGNFTPSSINNSLEVALSVDAAPLVYEFDLGPYFALVYEFDLGPYFVPNGDATLTFDITADINAANEYISVVADAGEAGSIDLGYLFNHGYATSDPATATATATITLTQEQLETLLSNGTEEDKGKFTLTVKPTGAVDNFTPALPNSLAITLEVQPDMTISA